MSEQTPKDDPIFEIGKDPVSCFEIDGLERAVVEAAVAFQKSLGRLHGISPEARNLDDATADLIVAREKAFPSQS